MDEKPKRRWWQVDPEAQARFERLEERASSINWKTTILGAGPLMLIALYYSEGGFKSDLVGQSCIIAAGVWNIFLVWTLFRDLK